jgi:hypothetical protein
LCNRNASKTVFAASNRQTLSLKLTPGVTQGAELRSAKPVGISETGSVDGPDRAMTYNSLFLLVITGTEKREVGCCVIQN